MRRGSGFTLIEVLVGMAVTGIFLTFVYRILLAHQAAFLVQDALADARQNARIGLDELTRSLSSAGAGVDLDCGQMRILVAHPYQVVFNADLSSEHAAPAPAITRVPGAQAADPWAYLPGSYSTSPAETIRYTLDRNGDGKVDLADRSQGEHYSLYREVNGGSNQELALAVGNPRLGTPLFRYEADCDGDGSPEVLTRVDRATCARVGSGEPLDAVIRKVGIDLVTESASRDPAWPGGYRQVRYTSWVTLRNLN